MDHPREIAHRVIPLESETPLTALTRAIAVGHAADLIAAAVSEAVILERERCAKLADRHAEDAEHLTQAESTAILIAADIRMRR